MTTFKDYAEFYDLFYAEKDYPAECSYVMSIVDKFSERPVRSLLDIGCGTGGHALCWARNGLNVSGLDLSSEMLALAKDKSRKLKLDVPFLTGDVRNFSLGTRFDAVTSMFAVMSYQTTNEDILSTFHSVRGHLESGGLFIFDAWSGPGVLSDPPHDRVGSFRRGNLEVLRTVRPKHDVFRHVVEIYYDILCIEGDKILKRIKEVHPMRYFFPQEVTDYASRTGFELVASEPFMQHSESLRVSDWNVLFVLKAV